MAQFAGILQYHAFATTNGTYNYKASVIICDTVTGTTWSGHTDNVFVPFVTGSQWQELIVAGVVSAGAAQGFTELYGSNVTVLPWSSGDRRPHQMAAWTKDITKSSIGINYVNVYAGLGGESQLIPLFTTNTQVRVVVFVNKVGTGTQTAAIMDAFTGTNVLVSAVDGTAAGEHALDSGWVNIPAWAFNTTVTVKPMAKSTVATDSPVYRGFQVYVQ